MAGTVLTCPGAKPDFKYGDTIQLPSILDLLGQCAFLVLCLGMRPCVLIFSWVNMVTVDMENMVKMSMCGKSS